MYIALGLLFVGCVVLWCDVMCGCIVVFDVIVLFCVCVCVAFQYLKRGSFFPLDYSHPLAHLSLQIKPYSITVNAGALWTKLALISSFT